ncbi:MAG: YqjF family protein [Terriglobales bacterium]
MTPNELLSQHSHRPFPLPKSPWVMRQEWHNLLFAHWALPADIVREVVPHELPLDLWEGKAYVGVVPFQIRNLRPRGVPPFPGVSHLGEINLRTYVTIDDKCGVYFFSLDAENVSAVLAARLVYALPYFKAKFGIHIKGDEISYTSHRTTRPKPAGFSAKYRLTSEVLPWRPMVQALERFVTERYCLYTVVAGHVYRTNIHHLPWPLQLASAEITTNTIAQTVPLDLSTPPPLLHFSKFIDVLVWWPERVS